MRGAAHKVAHLAIVNGKHYDRAPVTGTVWDNTLCRGCVGDKDADLCNALPECATVGSSIIFIERK